MRNPLQEQMLKAGLVKKAKVNQVAREQGKKHKGKTAPTPDGAGVDARRLQAERAERDRALAAERNASARARELRAQIMQIVDGHKVAHDGEIAYRFPDESVIRSLMVDEQQRRQLADGLLVIVRHGDGYALLPRAAADKIRERDAGMVVLDHGRRDPRAESTSDDTDDAYYRQFEVPDDLIW